MNGEGSNIFSLVRGGGQAFFYLSEGVKYFFQHFWDHHNWLTRFLLLCPLLQFKIFNKVATLFLQHSFEWSI